MAPESLSNDGQTASQHGSVADEPAPTAGNARVSRRVGWKQFLGVKRDSRHPSGVLEGEDTSNRERWTMGMLNDKETDEVPGTSREPTSRLKTTYTNRLFRAQRHRLAPCLESQ
jgi:hypothetical protein